MTQTIVSIVLFLVVLALLPLAIRAYQLRAPKGRAVSLSSRVLSSVAVGPQQRVVTVEVGPPSHPVRLVVGVTAHNVNCLYVFPEAAGDGHAPVSGPASGLAPSFSVTDPAGLTSPGAV